MASGDAVQGIQRHMCGKTTYGFCSLKAWQKILILFLGWLKKPCWWKNEATYQTCINHMCSFSVFGLSTLKTGDFVLNGCHVSCLHWHPNKLPAPKGNRIVCMSLSMASKAPWPQRQEPFLLLLPSSLPPRMMSMLVTTPERSQTPQVPGQTSPPSRRMVTISISHPGVKHHSHQINLVLHCFTVVSDETTDHLLSPREDWFVWSLIQTSSMSNDLFCQIKPI